jgi:exonuclease VII large subunit
MTQSESFDPQSIAHSYEQFADIELIETESLEVESLSIESLELKKAEQAAASRCMHWQDHLLPASCIAAEDSLTVLRRELETAHQLLQSQQRVMDSLTQQLTNRDLQLQHTQNELACVRHTSDRQSAMLTESEGICRDLKTQLRRQQQRVLQYRSLLSEQISGPVLTPFSGSVSMGYEPATASVEAVAAAKSNPVSAWSAPRSIGLTGPLACYRELATIRMAPSLTESGASSSLLANDVKGYTAAYSAYLSEAERLGGGQQVRIELPKFTRTASS